MRSSVADVVQVSYGGIFATSVSAIEKTDKSVWEMAERRLRRGNNVQEGH